MLVRKGLFDKETLEHVPQAKPSHWQSPLSQVMTLTEYPEHAGKAGRRVLLKSTSAVILTVHSVFLFANSGHLPWRPSVQ